MLGADGVFNGDAARSALALVAASAAVLSVNGEIVRDLRSLGLGDVPAGCTAEGFTVVVALEIDCLAFFSASPKHSIDSSSVQMRSNLVLPATGSARIMLLPVK